MAKKMRCFIKRFPLWLLMALWVNIIIGNVTDAQTTHQAYWTDSSDVRFFNNKLELWSYNTEELRLKAEIPAGETLRAFHFTLTYDPTVFSVVKAAKSENSIFQTVINETVPGIISFNGFDNNGVSGGTDGVTISLLDIIIKGVGEGISDFDITINNFGDTDTPSNEFKPTPVPLSVDVSSGNFDNKTYFTNELGIKMTELNLEMVTEQKTIRLIAEIPEGKTLKAYQFTLTYDNTVIEVIDYNDAISPFSNAEMKYLETNHDQTTGTIITAAFGPEGLVGSEVSIMDITVRGLSPGSSLFQIAVDSFGTESSYQFIPESEPLMINVTGEFLQKITLSPSSIQIEPDDTFTISAIYDVSPRNNTLSGLGVRFHYDSTKLAFTGFAYLFEPGSIGTEVEPQQDTEDFDNDETTDKFVSAVWSDLEGNWTGVDTTLSMEIAKLDFKAIGETEAVFVNVSFSDTTAGYNGISENAVVSIIPVIKTGDANGDGIVNIWDAFILLRHLQGIEVIENIFLLNALDVNADGKIDNTDAYGIQRYDLGLPCNCILDNSY